MSTIFIGFPVAVCLLAAGVAGVLRPWVLNKTLSLPWYTRLLALAPAAGFVVLAASIPAALAGDALIWRLPWMPSLGLDVSLYLDGLSLLFGMLVSGIGTVIVLYAGYYFKDEPDAWRFLVYLLLFTASMLGLVLAGDVITLFVFWEGTSVTSFLLVAYKYKDEAARRGAFKALFITGGGGIALLGGLVIMAYVAGGSAYTTLLASGEVLRESPLYPVLLGLVAFGAFTKSAQFPAHIWLPDAMSAPTPASAFLHSATMVKAGIYLMARLYPALGGTEAWFWLLGMVGAATMLVGAYLGLKQTDLKALLAYSTISQLGVLMMLIGQETYIAFKALIIGIIAHALYKSALFLVAGIVDHEAHTRDLRRLGGLRSSMRASTIVAVVAGLSMAGLPPLFGFLAKETLLAAATHPSLPEPLVWVFPLAAVVAGALILAQAGIFVIDTFFGQPRDTHVHAHEAPRGMWLMPAIPAGLSLLISLWPEAEPIEEFIRAAAEAAYNDKVEVSLALFTGFNAPLLLSMAAISLGVGIFYFKVRVQDLQRAFSERWTFNRLYQAVLGRIDAAASAVTATQAGRLRVYLCVMLLALLGLLLLVGRVPLPTADQFSFGIGELPVLRAFTLLLSVAAALVSVLIRRDLFAIFALGASSLSIAVLMVLEPTPDVALVQIVVDILTTVILVLALTRIPYTRRDAARRLNDAPGRFGPLGAGVVATGLGVVISLVVFAALSSRPRVSQVTPYYEQNSDPLTGAHDIVGAIVVDFRGFDTMIEITVFSMAGLAIFTLLTYATKKHNDADTPPPDAPVDASEPLTPRVITRDLLDIAGLRTSPFVRMLAYTTLPLTLMIAFTHMIYGHAQPGDGFTAGVIISLGVGFWYIVLGYEYTKRRLFWLRPLPLMASGILLVLASSVAPALMGSSFFAPVDFGKLWGLPLPAGFYLSTSFLFEVAICLAVLGSATLMIDTLGRPQGAL